jgi:DNA transformation protein and related proteins
MADPKGDKLFVNLGASQTRRRLKGFGHGVRKVLSTGRNQAAIIHTATRQHLRELEALFADVGFASTETGLGVPIDNLPNLGPTSAAWLRDAGVRTIGDLERIGPAAAYLRVLERQPRATLNLLWALAAGLLGHDWRELSEEQKSMLLREVREHGS